jgi:DNA-binding MarR family transcriptional regulator
LSTGPSDHRLDADGAANAQAEPARSPGADEVFEALIATVHALVRFGNARLSQYQAEGNSESASAADIPISLLTKLSEPRLRVLKALAESVSLRMGDLAALLGVKPRTVTDLVDGLEREGFVVRRPDASDRRVTRLELTPEMQVLSEQVRARFQQIGEEALSPLSQAERQQLLELLRHLNMGPIGQVTRRSSREMEMILQRLADVP